MNDSMPNFWTNSCVNKDYNLVFNNKTKSSFKVNVKFSSNPDESHTFTINGKEYKVSLDQLNHLKRTYQCDVNGHRVKLSYFQDTETEFYNCFLKDRIYEFKIEEPKYVKELRGSRSSEASSNDAMSPMPGLVDKINVKVGDSVKKGDPLCVMIAMKMEYVIKASRDGVVKSVNCNVGQNVKKSTKLIVLSD